MNHRSSTEDRVFGLIDDLYAAALEPSLWPAVFDGMASLTGGAGTIVLADSRNHSSHAYRSPNIDSFVEGCAPELMDCSPRLHYARKIATTDAIVTDAHMIGVEGMKRSAFFNELLWPGQLGEMMARMTNSERGTSKTVICVQRSLLAGFPSDLEMKIFAVLSSHAHRALQVFRRLATRQIAGTGAADLFERLDCGVVLVGADGNILHANAVARRIDGNGILLGRKGLAASTPADQTKLDRLIREALAPASADDGLKLATLRREDANAPLLVQVVPVRAPDNPYLRIFSDVVQGALVLLIDPAQEIQAQPMDALRLLGLTETEAAIAALVGSGRSPEDVAARRNISVGTARLHLKRIYFKLDITRQSQLAQIVAALSITARPD
ncbi:helix-turn-helix transcriptional regulator [Parvibaculum sp.]|uniref:helix-turn-helix transcriptional regulator n=1 Tax=Parvibaculum sp. TaxID=2024848 RepID=UPI002B7C2716|nr:LuxR C-terminal-related transcriptional regulator [Parvibaculum sp.]HUD53250.1 LuxR C-terminal-related transcriptional regulator [Parvibaculum sp.]